MKHAIWIFIATYSAAAMVACSKAENDTPAPAANAGCPPGTTFSNGVCYNQYWQPVTGAGLAFKTDNFRDKTLMVSNSSVFRTFLRDAMAVCDRASSNYGTASCSSWATGYVQVVLQQVNAATNTVRMTIEVQPQTYQNYGWGYGSYYAALPSAGQAATCGITWLITGYCMSYPTTGQMSIARNPLALDLVVSAINNSQGFEARGYGGYGTPSQTALIQLQVENGKLDHSAFSYKLIYNGQAGGQFLSGTMYRCNDSSCGVHYYGY